MDPFEGAVLGIVQGLTEPLPISSSAHLVLVPWLLGWPEHSLTFDVALHMGTLAALLIFFWRDLLLLVRAWLPGAGGVPGPWAPLGPGAQPDRPMPPPRRTIRCAASSAGWGWGSWWAASPPRCWGPCSPTRSSPACAPRSRSPPCSSSGRCCWGSPTASAPGAWSCTDVGLTQALLVGLAQALALAPGVSRSGITLTAALFIGLTREAGARYAFLLGIPVTAGAGVFQLRRLLRDGIPVDERAAFALGVFCSLVVGLLAIRFLLRYVRQHSLNLFVYYRLALGLIVLLVAALRGAAG